MEQSTNDTQGEAKRHRFTVYIHSTFGDPTLLYGGEKERVLGFLRFWKLYRPYALITIRSFDYTNGVITRFHGETKDFKGLVDYDVN